MSIFSELEAGVIASTADDMHRLAARLASVFPTDGTLALRGDLGAGKTTFVKGLAAAWGVSEAVTSPSFTVCNLHRGERLLVHVDAYRLSTSADWDSLLIEEFLVSPWCLVVEWPERVRDRLPADTFWLGIEIQHDLSRLVRQLAPLADVPNA